MAAKSLPPDTVVSFIPSRSKGRPPASHASADGISCGSAGSSTLKARIRPAVKYMVSRR
jgi:hypothetical protein